MSPTTGVLAIGFARGLVGPKLKPINRQIDHRRLFEQTRRILTPGEAGRTDWLGPVIILLLALFGVVFIHSATLTAGGNYWARQLVWMVLGAGVYVVASQLDYKLYLENALWFWLGAVLLLLLIFTPLGVTREGATRWLNFVVMNFQPSEAAKAATLIMVASILARSELGTVGQSVYALGKTLLVMLIPMILIFLQPDLGSCLIIPPVVLALLYVSRLSQRFFVAVFVFSMLFGTWLGADLYRYAAFLQANELTAHEARGQYQEESFFPFLRDYQRERIMGFVNPAVIDPTGTEAAWNRNQSMRAVGAGGPLGKGRGKGLQAQLGYLPRSVAHNDFIFAVLAEERGFVGAGLVIGLFGALLANGVRIAGQARDRFGMLLAVGVTVIFLIHIFVNIGMTIGLTPITGLPLPFLSYGGSFLLSCCFLQGIVQSVYRHRRERW
ncbi:MAG: FtsW/RodA/SpoVE family cell cycle protein [Opitutales bacterium]